MVIGQMVRELSAMRFGAARDVGAIALDDEREFQVRARSGGDGAGGEDACC